MNCYSKKCINLVTLILAIVIFIQTNFLTFIIFNLKNDVVESKIAKIEENQEKLSEEETIKEWKIMIPKINVSAEIQDGTEEEIINNYIGHFTQTPIINGNIGLVGASAGYKENYFAELEKLQEGDVIIYIKDENRKEYKVIKNVIISQTDWSYLSSTQDNRITLITGILEQPENRRCVQAVEII